MSDQPGLPTEQWYARHVTYTGGGTHTERTTEERVFVDWLQALPGLYADPQVASVSMHTGALAWSADVTPRIADEIARRTSSEDKT